MRGEAEIVMKMVKKTVDSDTYKKLSKISDANELTNAAKYTLIRTLENEEHALGKKIQYMKNYGKDTFFAEGKYLLIDSKIKHLKATFSKEDYAKVMNLIGKVREEIEHVQSIKSV